ncbi:MAG: hypothetical protein ACO37W_06745 [Prochlorotrichaceae cyanobacterium]
MSPRPVPPVSDPYPSSPSGSRRVLAGLLRGLGEILQDWADRLEAAITQVTATLPDPRVRQDLWAKLWRIWLTIVAQLDRRLPRGWGVGVISFLTIAIVSSLVGLGLWFLVSLFNFPPKFSEDFTTAPVAPPQVRPQPAADQPLESVETPDHSLDTAVDEGSEYSSRDTPDPVERSADPAPLPPEPDILPLGPPVPDWSTIVVTSPFESMLQAKLIQGLPRSLPPLIQRIQVNFSLQELTIHLTDQWNTLTSLEQHQFVETLRTQARKLDFPHLQVVDEQGALQARTAIVGQGIIFLSPF